MKLLWAFCCYAAMLRAADISGTVSVSGKQVPLPGATVVLHIPQRDLRTVTDDMGAFVFPGFQAGPQHVSRSEYAPDSINTCEKSRGFPAIPAGWMFTWISRMSMTRLR